ncbi:MAG: nuclear transport factor 2 family protein [Kordia sp.]|uniref:nuclear transport factor 2 family protein n=1 Tax=Kordia sp. TaxID=1965332 RepID=UPI00385A7A27
MKKRIVLLLLFVSFFSVTAQKGNAADVLVQKQIDAYNAKNIDTFAATFSDDVIFYNFPKEVNFKGIAKVREVFSTLFKNNPDLYCTIEDRIVVENTVVYHEKVQFKKNTPIVSFVVMYKVLNNKITEVYFLERSK